MHASGERNSYSLFSIASLLFIFRTVLSCIGSAYHVCDPDIESVNVIIKSQSEIVAGVLPKKLLVEEDSPSVTESEHVFADGRVAVILVNNALEPFAGPIRVAAGWRIVSTLTDRSDLARCEGGRLSLGTNAGILLMLERK